MSKFTFVLPDGQIFELTGTSTTTRAQAERIFNEQLASGALVGLRRGDTVQNPAAQIVDFTLSRLDRGTAGVDDLPLLAINNQGIISALPLVDQPVSDPIDIADYIAQTPPKSVGPLSPSQVQAIMAAAAKNPGNGVGKYGLTIPQLESAGVVKPGTGCRFAGIANTPQAQSQSNPANLLDVLNSPSVYTGLYNITSLDDLLADETSQDRIQESLIRSSYELLVETGQIQTTSSTTNPPVGAVYTGTSANIGTAVALGTTLVGALSSVNFASIGSSVTGVLNGFGKGITNIASKIGNISFDSANTASLGGLSFDKITGNISNLAGRGIAELGGLLSNAAKFGVDTTVTWAKGLNPDNLTSQLNGLYKQGQFAVNFNDFKLPTTVAGFAPAAGFVGTTNRQTVDLATAKIIGSSKIPTPSYGSTSIDESFGGIGASFGSINPTEFANKLGSLNIKSFTGSLATPGIVPTNYGQTIPNSQGIPTSVAGVVTNPGIN